MPSTPKRTTNSISSPPSQSIPYTASSNKSHEKLSRSQKSLQDKMKTELSLATFESKRLLDERYPAKAVVVDAVIAKLKKVHNVTHNNLRYCDWSQTPKSWPNVLAPERNHYKPFSWLLNEIICLSRMEIKTKTFHEKLRFFPYDRPMLECMEGDSPLKPDIVGCHREELLDRDHVSWAKVQVSVEVKNRWPDMVLQMSTYARCCLAFQCSRIFMTVIHFNHVRREVKMGLHTRSGLVVTPELALGEETGFRDFVRAIVGIYSWTTPGRAGFDTSRTNTHFFIPERGLYSITKVFCDRKCVRGRATRVYRLQKETGSSAALAAPIENRYNLRSTQHRRGRLQTEESGLSSSLERISLHDRDTTDAKTSSAASDREPALIGAGAEYHEWDADVTYDQDENPSLPQDPGAIDGKTDQKTLESPSVVVLKDSWPLESRTDEGQMFQSLKKRGFGLPEVLCAYDVTTDDVTGCTDDLIPSDATYWDVFGFKPTKEPKPEKRRHRRVILKTEGIYLEAARGPRHLVEGIVHAMLGHYLMFKDGWLHRDVSIGNVMLMKEETREAVEDFTVTRNITQCVGFISDGDQAILWKDTNRTIGDHRSGTLPFMSLQLIKAWYQGKSVLHTAIDDLESFTWVLLWAVLNILESSHVLEITDRDILAVMRTDDLATLRNRADTLDDLQMQQETHAYSKGIKPFGPLLIRWLKIAKLAARRVRLHSADSAALELYCHGVYKQYIEAGFDHMAALPESWEYLD